jgi:hypothetical protein
MRRTMAAEAEPIRQTVSKPLSPLTLIPVQLKFIVSNLQYSAEIRAQAALDLTRMPGNTRLVRVKNRCVISSRGRAVMRDFKYE